MANGESIRCLAPVVFARGLVYGLGNPSFLDHVRASREWLGQSTQTVRALATTGRDFDPIPALDRAAKLVDARSYLKIRFFVVTLGTCRMVTLSKPWISDLVLSRLRTPIRVQCDSPASRAFVFCLGVRGLVNPQNAVRMWNSIPSGLVRIRLRTTRRNDDPSMNKSRGSGSLGLRSRGGQCRLSAPIVFGVALYNKVIDIDFQVAAHLPLERLSTSRWSVKSDYAATIALFDHNWVGEPVMSVRDAPPSYCTCGGAVTASFISMVAQLDTFIGSMALSLLILPYPFPTRCSSGVRIGGGFGKFEPSVARQAYSSAALALMSSESELGGLSIREEAFVQAAVDIATASYHWTLMRRLWFS
ncbi:hypothetical protein Tco_0865433 [Tanacetum coccineum]